MQLMIAAQDIRLMSLALVEEGRVVSEQSFEVSPEQHLHTIDAFVSSQGVLVSELTGLIVVTGPGSFTASRVSTTIANTMAFAGSVPVVGVANPDRLSLSELAATISTQGQAYVEPSYDRPAHITQPRKGNASH